MYKTIKNIFKLISLTFLCQWLFGIQLQAGELDLVDYLADLSHLRTNGQLSLFDNFKSDQRAAVLQTIGEESVWWGLVDTLPTRDNFTLDLDFSVSNFAEGDSWELIYFYLDWDEYDSINCQVKNTAWQCQIIRTKQATRTVLLANQNLGSWRTPLVNHSQTLTLQLSKQNSNLDFGLWEKTFPERGRIFLRASHLYTGWEKNLSLPVVKLETSQPNRRQKTYNLQRLFYGDPDYLAQLSVFAFYQTDPLWSTEILGHTDQLLSPQTIGEIGCALTSAAMIFNYYGYSFLPNGDTLDPSGLNRWLKQQPDGYINYNLLNWQALARLSTQLHQSYRALSLWLPKFEYKLYHYNGQADFYATIAQTKIEQKQPLLLEIPGHFMINRGVSYNYNLSINDPYFTTFDQLAQHFERGFGVKSVRHFQPSFTDQSYIIVNLFGQGDLELIDHEGTQSAIIIDLYEPQSAVDESVIIGHQLLLAQPVSDTYTLRLDHTDDQTRLSVMIYNQSGEVQLYDNGEKLLETWQTDEQKSNHEWQLTFTFDKQQETDFVKFLNRQVDDNQDDDSWQDLLVNTVWQPKWLAWTLEHTLSNFGWPAWHWQLADYWRRGLLPDEIYQLFVTSQATP